MGNLGTIRKFYSIFFWLITCNKLDCTLALQLIKETQWSVFIYNRIVLDSRTWFLNITAFFCFHISCTPSSRETTNKFPIECFCKISSHNNSLNAKVRMKYLWFSISQMCHINICFFNVALQSPEYVLHQYEKIPQSHNYISNSFTNTLYNATVLS